ncbi:MAG: cation:dicarboxylase symporter family transporter [Clostridia bacterium]|nr:cation:dicarboxylase symporter family transporter [Clostridia bacterium]
MWKEKEPLKFLLTLENLGEVSAELQTYLQEHRTDEKDVQSALLLLEEISVRFFEHAPNVPVKVRVRSRRGSISLVLTQESEDFNPIAEIRDWGTESENYFRTLIFRANSEKLDYARQNGKNVVVIRARRPKYNMMILALAMLVAGTILGLVMVQTLSPERAGFIDYEVFDTIRTLFFNALGMLIIPMIFCSVVTTIAGLSSLSDTGRLGGKAIRTYMTTTFMAILVGFGAAYLLLPRKLPSAVQAMAAGSEAGEAANLLGRDLLIGLIPRNILDPIQNANILQVMLLAVLVGIALGILGEKIQVLNRLIEDLTNLFQVLVNLVAAFMPLVTLAATASLMINVGLPVIPLLARLIFAEFVAVAVMWLIYSIQLGIGRLSPIPFWRAMPGFFHKAGLPNYSGAYLPFSMELCTRKFGVSPRVASFTTSLGATINMDGACVHFVLCSVLFARLFDVELDGQMLVTIALAVFILSMGDSAVQNSSIISMTSILTLMGVPTSALGLILGVDAVLDMFRCGSNIIGDLCATLTIGKSEGEMNEAKYKEKPVRPAA